MNEKALVLYGESNFVSPYVLSVFVSLTEKKIPFEIMTVDLQTKEHLQSEYSQISRSRRVPALVEDDFSLSESSAISEYLDEKYPFPDYPRLYPEDLRERALAREVQAWLRSDLMPIREERSTEVIFYGEQKPPLSEAALASADKLFAAAERLLNGKDSFLFEDWCIADTDLAVMLNRLVAAGDSVPEKLADYVAAQWQRSSVQSWVQRSQTQPS